MANHSWRIFTRGGQRDVPEQEWLRQPQPSQEAERPRYARDDAASQQCEIRFIFLRKIAIA
jgi:hypothetical protein